MDRRMVMRLSAVSLKFLWTTLNNLRSKIKSLTSQTKLHVYCKHGFGFHTRGSFVCMFIDDLDNISFLRNEDNDLEQISHLFNEVSIFIFKFEKKPPSNQALNTVKAFTIIRGNFKRFQICFLVEQQFGTRTFSANKDSMPH